MSEVETAEMIDSPITEKWIGGVLKIPRAAGIDEERGVH